MVQEVQRHQEIRVESHLPRIEILGQVLLAHLLEVKVEVEIVAEEDQLPDHLLAHREEEEDNSVFNITLIDFNFK